MLIRLQCVHFTLPHCLNLECRWDITNDVSTYSVFRWPCRFTRCQSCSVFSVVVPPLPMSSSTDQCLCFRYIDSTFPPHPKSKLSSIQPCSVAAQFSFCRTWSEIPKTDFLVKRLNYAHTKGKYNTKLMPLTINRENFE